MKTLSKSLKIAFKRSYLRKKIVFAGIGGSYWAARFAEFLWREY
jgi:glucose-6-phosphate isomerase